jgi:predicted ATP-grasp superfamily ATP-dependent carboligase
VPALVVAALSARMLAQSARRAGWDVIALDLFGDVDTRAAAKAWHAIGAASTMRIDGDRFLAALESARESADCIGWVAGAGFEPQPALLEAGAQRLPLLGNDRATIDRVRDPRQFFTTLAELDIPHPETRIELPAASDGTDWLMKDFAASGGWHIRRTRTAHGHPTGAQTYFQRDIAGRPMSVLFIADGDRALPIAINELLVRPHGARPYVYHGAIGPVSEPASARHPELAQAIQAMVQAFGLRGLGSMDFVLHGDDFSVLEVNPRPSSTVGLHDADFASGLVKVHVDACTGAWPGALPPIDAGAIRGEFIVFARSTSVVTHEHVDRLLALRCRDVPRPLSRIEVGAPLCTVSAQSNDAANVLAMLAQQEATVLSIVQNRSEANHHAS